MSDEERTGSCPCCALRDPRTPLVCDACRSRLRSWLRELPGLLAELDETRFEPAVRHDVGGKVTGSRERRLPIRVDPTDLLGPAKHVLLLGEDQIGYESVASELDFWVRDWREARGGAERLPDPDVRTLASWLERRAEDACDAHPAIDEMFTAIRRIRLTLLGQLGKFDVPDYKKGVPCRRCDTMALVRHNGSDWIECGNCPELLSPDEYDRWCGLLAAAAKSVTPSG